MTRFLWPGHGRMRPVVALVLIAALVLTPIWNASAAVWTDQEDYAPGSVVTISGDNSDGAGYLAGETVHVDVSGPNGYTSACEASADENGAWSCQVELWDTVLAVGEYSYTAVAQTSGVSQSGTFKDAIYINSFASDCVSASDSFTSGVTVCAKVTGRPGGPGGGEPGKIEWWAPGASTPTRTTHFSGGSGNKTDTFTPTTCGTWTLKVFVPDYIFQDDDTFEVTGCSTNTPPSVGSDNASVTVNEGTTATNTGTWFDADANDVTLSASVGTVVKNGDGTWSWSLVTMDGPDDGQTVTITADDGNGGVTETTFALTVNNVAPTAAFYYPTSVDEGSSIGLSLTSPYDPSSVDTAAGFEYAFNCGSGYGAFDSASTASCPTTDNGSPYVGGQIRDKDGGVTEYNGTVTVNNVAPVIYNLTPPFGSVYAVNTSVSVTGWFTDAGTADTHTCQINWDDGTTTGGTVSEVNGSGTCSGSRSYAEAGVYTIQVMVTDDDGDSDTESFMVVVYDPSAGFVTGGGWINSPAGAYAPDPSLAGRANFGFVSKYKKGATVPTGQTEFQFKVANLNVHSNAYEWLVVSGAKAQYKGTGTVNGAGSYGFMLTATDGQINGGGGVDKFRIKIWVIGGAVVYDNQPGDGDTANPTTAIAGGSIVIHSK